MAGILVDCHTHPRRTPDDLPASTHAAHFRESIRSYAVRAAELGLTELGLSEHVYRLRALATINWAIGVGDTGRDDGLAVR